MTRDEMQQMAKLNAKARRRSQSMEALIILFVVIPVIVIGILVAFVAFSR